VNISGVLPGIFLIGVFLGGKEKPQAHACGDESQILFETIYIDQQEARTTCVGKQELICLTYSDLLSISFNSTPISLDDFS
jgi:hypothetical protein